MRYTPCVLYSNAYIYAPAYLRLSMAVGATCCDAMSCRNYSQRGVSVLPARVANVAVAPAALQANAAQGTYSDVLHAGIIWLSTWPQVAAHHSYLKRMSHASVHVCM